MKIWKAFLKCPVLFLLLAGWAGISVYTCTEGKLPYAIKNDVIRNPIFTALLDADGAPDSILDDLQKELDAEESMDLAVMEPIDDETGGSQDTAKNDERGSGTKNSPQNAEKAASSHDKKTGSKKPDSKKANTGDQAEEEVGVTRYKKYEKQQIVSPFYSDPGMKALTTEYPYEKVDKSYFDDALFIGDSRTDGMQNYSGLDNATFFAKTGLNVYELLEDEFLTDPSNGKQVSVSDRLKHDHYGKIYFMIGINELGTGNTGTFQKAYERVLSKFRKWQPDAVIYIQGILPVSKKKSDADTVYNNININDKNVAISQLADGKNIFYLDVSTELTDKNGNLKEEYTFDDVHMYAQYYSLWTDYLMEHAVVR